MKKIVIIGANSFQLPLVLKAHEMGYETHVFAWEEGAVAKEYADYFYPISITRQKDILEECKMIKPDAVVSIATDLGNITVQYVAKRLGLTCNSDECILYSTNKFAMRNALMKAGLPVPKYEIVSQLADFSENMNYPIIVKPTDRSGSRSITKLMSSDGLEAAISDAVSSSFEKKAIVEEYINGEEYSCESISYKGEHHILAVTKKYTTGAPHYIETGHMEPSDLTSDMVDKVADEVSRALDALKVEYGASHAEFKVDADGNVRFIEIGSRMGGDCIGSDLVRLSTGYDFVKMVIQTGLGEEPDLRKVCVPRTALIKFIMNENDYNQLLEDRKDMSKHIWRESDIEKPGTREVTDSSTRFGYYIYTIG